MKHRAVHALGIAASHFVPIVAGQLHLGPVGQADLGHRDEIVEPSLPRRFLGQEQLEVV